MKIKIVLDPQYTWLHNTCQKLATTGIPDNAIPVYRTRRNRIVRIEDGRGGWLNIKAFRLPRFPNDWIYGNMRGSKAKRSYQNARRLLEMGFDTPYPIGYIEVSSHRHMGYTYYISRQETPDGDMREWDKNPNARAALPTVARMIADMHAKGVFHRDLSPGNIMFNKRPDGTYRLMLVDLNRMDFGVYNHSKLMRNFSAIYPENIAETQYLARLYAAEAGLDADKTAAEARRQVEDFYARQERKKRIKALLGLGKK